MNKTICLNMIVKNESHIIEETLKLLIEKIKIDYYVICDTGSNDNTVELIETFFNKWNIQGKIHFHTWKDFGHNRSLALTCAKDICDYLLIFDSDDYIVGDINLNKLTHDGYLLKFGNNTAFYQRKILVKSCFPWKFNGVLHECIGCDVPTNEVVLEGNYYIVSGKTSSRNKNPTKYLDDAKILEKAFVNSLETNDGLFSRYSYYCANSYFDAGKKDQAIKWYKKTLTLNGWFEEKYNSCLALHQLIDDESRFYFLVKSFTYNPTRIEGIYELVKYYTCEQQYNIAWNYYTLIKKYFETEYYPSNGDLSSRLFVKTMDYSFFLPYYMIIVCSYIKEYTTGVLMLKIILKHKGYSGKWWVDNLFYNLQFYKEYITEDLKKECLSYISFLKEKGIHPKETTLFKKNILFYTGFSDTLWNLTTSEKNPLGGSERAICYLSQELSKYFTIYITGDVLPEQKNGVVFVNRNGIQNLLDTTHFESIIISRYISFFTLYTPKKYNTIYIMGHDIYLLNNVHGCNLTPNEILSNYRVTGTVCLTNWHRDNFKMKYPLLKNVSVINNGICPELFPPKKLKKRNSFIYTSCSVRGLLRLVEIWKDILQELPDATLNISSYLEFPLNEQDRLIQTIIDKFPDTIKHLGQLNQTELYNVMGVSEYWLYPCSFQETSCITAMEMLMSEVICLYYPIAGLTDTLGNYGIKVSENTEIETIVNLSEKQKKILRTNGKEYALTCSWKHRAEEWNLLLKKKKKWVFYYNLYHITSIKDYINNLNNESCEVYLTNEIEFIKKINPDEITVILNNFMNGNYNCVPDLTDIKENVTFLQLEPLNLPHRIECLKRVKWDTFIYDYSLSNIKILNEYGIQSVYLPYIVKEKEYLSKIFKETKKEYHFGFINKKTSMPITPPRRNKVLAYLFDSGFKVNIVSGWGEDRDRELAKCKVILNIHGQINENENPCPEECSNIFEHIRCDRLLESGFEVLSEESYCLDQAFKMKYPNLKIIKYTDFFTLHGTVPLESF